MQITPQRFPLHMYNYWVTEYRFKTAVNYEKPESGVVYISPDDPLFIVQTHSFQDMDGSIRDWNTYLSIELTNQEPSEEGDTEEQASKFPFTFFIEMYGMFKVAEEFPENGISHLVETTGPSLLYSAAREFIVATTGHSPRHPIFLPTVSFYTPPNSEPEPVRELEPPEKEVEAHEVEKPHRPTRKIKVKKKTES